MDFNKRRMEDERRHAPEKEATILTRDRAADP